MIKYRIASKDEVSNVYALREQVFVIEQGVPVKLEIDEFDNYATHVIALDGITVIACGRLIKLKDYMKIGRVAVRQEYRGKGIGQKIIMYLVELAEIARKPIKLDSQLQAINFYKKLGFIEEGEVFLDAGIQHLKMVYCGKVK